MGPTNWYRPAETSNADHPGGSSNQWARSIPNLLGANLGAGSERFLQTKYACTEDANGTEWGAPMWKLKLQKKKQV
ncbi:hypothetical protein F441_07394 [Phytophthora nicotianae CJ01A1]|uniref:Uncharacterized protein n=4 Tax=Phytophthora nicotianae TaxID=4792 RepID=W2QCH0_PHYN3|nr:hypothetical protein PPTG_09933 [Phytophthora nicotianae INRA-310]ETL41916.1 hypothetical protein L916_07191 [Phytophthora nicotianae]ETN10868.1 hypothetical protein PPTG_09933 [Phytophthora nicotianae INRA-310]ETP18379.1 hypothetical protein F441_07394 [Phytophthora nicotianae CJ01A1]ETP46299.1 hypothetical protein F442_07441 [Phytophthora nicotianae P10297]